LIDGDVVSFVFSAFLVGLSATLPPGPIFVIVVTVSLEKGFIHGLMVVFGHAIVEILIIAILLFGLGSFLGSDVVKTFVNIGGGLVLILMGYNLLADSYRDRISTSLKNVLDKSAVYNPLVSGAIAAIVNPYFIIWWTMVGGAFIFKGLELFGLVGIVIFPLIHWASDFPWFSFISYCTSRGRRLLNDKVYRMIVGVCGVSLLALGTMFLVDGFIYIFF
jgi:threonine/homoserine/homoserine lactone efflux protein